MNMQNISEIKRLRKSLNLTQKELANKAQVSQSLIAKIEADKIDPTYSKTMQIFNALNNIIIKEKIQIKDIMQKEIISIKPETLILETIQIMKNYQISQMPIVSNHPIGLITESILLEKLSTINTDKLSKIKVREIMDECPPIISPECPIELVTNLLKHYPMILIKDKEKLSGLITKTDILNAFSKK